MSKTRKKLSKLNGKANGHDKSAKAVENEPPKPQQKVVVATTPRKMPIHVNTNQSRMFESYDPAVHPAEVMKMVLNGATERDIRTSLGISMPVFDMWRARYSEFAAALVVGKAGSLADERVARSLFEMANGYDQSATKIMQIEGEVVAVEYVERVQKNPMAAKAWLANRDPQNWGRNPEHAQPLQAPSVLNVKMIQGMDVEQLRAVVQLLRQTLAPITAQSGLKRLDVVDAVAEEVKEPA